MIRIPQIKSKIQQIKLKEGVCCFMGHNPRGPVAFELKEKGSSDVLFTYKCKRCEELIRFNSERGWLVL